jgi:hypothetical protein
VAITGAFELLVAGTPIASTRWRCGFVRSTPDAERSGAGCVQCVRAWRALPRFRGEAAFATWLHRIVVRCAFAGSPSCADGAEREADLDLALAASSDRHRSGAARGSSPARALGGRAAGHAARLR